MFTSVDKAIVAAIMGILSLLTLWGGFNFSWLTEETILSAIAILTPVIVWAAPNLKPKT